MPDLYDAAGLSPSPQPVDLYGAMQTVVSQAPQNKTNVLEDALHKTTGGISDKLEAALKAAGVPGGVQAGSFSDRYHKTLANIRNEYEDYDAANPGWTGAKAAKAASVVGPMLLMGPEKAAADTIDASAAALAAKKAPTFAGQVVKSGATGAGVGAAYGFGSTDDSSVLQDLEATGIGAGAGGGMGMALPLASGLASSPFRVFGRAGGLFGKAGQEASAGRILSEAKTGGNPFEPAPLPDMQLTTGQSSNDPGLLWLERSVREGSPKGAELSAGATAVNNSAIRTGITSLGGGQAGDPSQAMSDALEAAYAARKKSNSALWKAADVSNTGGVSGFQFNNYMNKYIAGLPVADQAAIPADIKSVMEHMAQAKTQNLSDVQSVRSMIGSRATMAARSGDANTARILGSDGLAGQVEKFIDMKAANLGQTLPAYNAARADTADMKQIFNTHPTIRKALGVDQYGADKLPVSATADAFIHSGKGAPEDLQAYLRAISSKDPKTGKITYDPVGFKAAQDAFSRRFLDTVSNAGVDANGNRLVSPAKMQSFLDDFSHVINSPLYTQPQRDLIGRIARATQMASRTANARPPGGGSDTFPKLQGDKFIDALIGPGASKIIGGVSKVGGALGGYLSDGKVGAAAGLFGGKEVGGMISDLFQAPRDKVINLVTEAMHDPQLAQDLMMKATNANAKLLPPPRRAKILGFLGAQAAQPAAQAVTAQ